MGNGGGLTAGLYAVCQVAPASTLLSIMPPSVSRVAIQRVEEFSGSTARPVTGAGELRKPSGMPERMLHVAPASRLRARTLCDGKEPDAATEYTAYTVEGILGSRTTIVAAIAVGIRFVQLAPPSMLFSSPTEAAA